jgi:hypothetical protein
MVALPHRVREILWISPLRRRENNVPAESGFLGRPGAGADPTKT